MSSLGGLLAALLVVAVVGMPASAADRDKDGLRDGFEARYGVTSPSRRDSDGDGVIDAAEDNDHDRLSNLGEQRFGSDPGRKDTDRDGRRDSGEDHDRDGKPNAVEQDQRRLPKALKPSLAEVTRYAPTLYVKCITGARQATLKRCAFGPADSPTTVAIMGDSHALAWLPAVIAASRAEGWRLVTLLKGGCSPVRLTMNGRQYRRDRGVACRAWRQDAYRWLNANPVDLLLITHADTYKLVDSRGRGLKPSRKPAAWRSGMMATIAGLPDPSKVMVLADVPHNPGDPIKCLKSHISDISACVNRREPLSRRPVELAFRAAAAAQGAQFGSLFDKICTYDPCPLVQGNILIWRDRHHLTTPFARQLMPSMRELLRRGLASAR
jgi:hypothetical protein